MSNHVTIHKAFFKSVKKEKLLHILILKSINRNALYSYTFQYHLENIFIFSIYRNYGSRNYATPSNT